jgi:putative transposase
MALVNRKVEYRLYPTPQQNAALLLMFETHRVFYNEARQQRIDVYKNEKRSISFAEQCRETTKSRATNTKLGECNAQSLQVTLKRLDLAMRHFFRRIKAQKPGEKPGYPRYKTELAFRGWGYKTHGDGWKFQVIGVRKALLKLSGVGSIRTRGKARTPGVPKTMEIIRRHQKWYASITMVCEPKRACGIETRSYDWGLKNYLTIVDEHGNVIKVENPRLMRKAIKKIKTKQNKLNRMEKKSNRSKKLKQEIAALYEKTCNRRKDFLHKTSAWLVSQCNVIVTEKLAVKSMVTDHSKKHSRSLHRSVLDAAPAMLNQMTSTKALEAAGLYHEIDTITVKPTQRCYQCWDVQPKTMDVRIHSCKKCGFTIDRDVNAALVMLKAFTSEGLARREGSGQPEPTKRETPSIAAHAA